MVHIEQVYEAFQEYAAASARAMQFSRQPMKWAEMMVEAREKLRSFCEKWELPIDFTE